MWATLLLYLPVKHIYIMPDTKKRNPVFDAVKLFAVFLMLWGHTLADFRTVDYTHNPIYLAIYSFHMPLFMAVVGFFSKSVDGLSLRGVVLTKIRQLILPAVAFYLPLAIGVLIKSGPETMIRNYISSFWFLKSAFICFMLFFLAKKVCVVRWIGIVVSLAVSMFINDFAVCKMYPFFVLGVLIRAVYPRIKHFAGRIVIISGLVFFSSMPLYDTGILCSGHVPPLLMALGYERWDYTAFYNFFVREITGISGTIFTIFLFEYIFNFNRPPFGKIVRRMAVLGSETLSVYLFQTVFIELPPKYVGYLDEMNTLVYSWLVTPLASFAVIILTHYITDWIKQHQWLAFLILGKPLSTKQMRRLVAD